MSLLASQTIRKDTAGCQLALLVGQQLAGRVEIPIIPSTIIVWPVPARGSYSVDHEAATGPGLETW